MAGAAYLVWLGWNVLPKGLLLHLSVMPQFLTTTGEHLPVAVQTTALGLPHMAACAAVCLTVGLAARTAAGDAMTCGRS